MSRRLLAGVGVLVLVAAVVSLAVLQRREAPAPQSQIVPKDVVLLYADGSEMMRVVPDRSSVPSDPLGHIRAQVVSELETGAGISLPQAHMVGVTIRTTIVSTMQAAAEAAVTEATAARPGTLKHSLTAIDPTDGAVRAYWPGNGAEDHALGVERELGSAFEVRAGAQAGEVARQAGVPDPAERVRPFHLAAAYATFAADGLRRTPHFIRDVRGAAGELLYRSVVAGTPAFGPDTVRSKEIADQITGELRSNPVCGGMACRPGVHGSTDAWMAGYTTALSVAVWVGADNGNVGGADLPTTIWKTFFAKA